MTILALALLAAAGGPCLPARPRDRAWIEPALAQGVTLPSSADGSVGFTLEVGEEGCVTACRITRSSGSAGLDRATCDLLAERIRFVDQQNRQSMAEAFSWSGMFMWNLPLLRNGALPVRAPNGEGSWVTGDDYPERALSGNMSGRVTFTLYVTDQGQSAGCLVQASSGFDLLDKTTCRLLNERARFVPVKGPDGRVRPFEWSSLFNWALPG